MAIKLNKDGSIDKRWQPKTTAELQEVLEYERRRAMEEINKLSRKITKSK